MLRKIEKKIILQISMDGIHLQFFLRKLIRSKLQKYITKLRLSSHPWKLVDIIYVTQIEGIDFVYFAELVLNIIFIFLIVFLLNVCLFVQNI